MDARAHRKAIQARYDAKPHRQEARRRRERAMLRRQRLDRLAHRHAMKSKALGRICARLEVINLAIIKDLKRRGFPGRRFAKDLLGCSAPDFQRFIASQLKPGMTWENYGKAWRVYQKTPIHLAWDEASVYTLGRYTNYEPRWTSGELHTIGTVVV